MIVADLRQHLEDLSKLLSASGAKSVGNDLTTISEGLKPFHDLSLKDFAGFLVKAEALSRGELPISSAKKPTTKKTKSDAPNADAISREVRELYGHAADPSVTSEAIEAVILRLKDLDKKSLLIVAESIELKGMKSKTIEAVIAAIRQRIILRKGATQRAGLLDRPSPNEAKNAEAAHPVVANHSSVSM